MYKCKKKTLKRDRNNCSKYRTIYCVCKSVRDKMYQQQVLYLHFIQFSDSGCSQPWGKERKKKKPEQLLRFGGVTNCCVLFGIHNSGPYAVTPSKKLVLCVQTFQTSVIMSFPTFGGGGGQPVNTVIRVPGKCINSSIVFGSFQARFEG